MLVVVGPPKAAVKVSSTVVGVNGFGSVPSGLPSSSSSGSVVFGSPSPSVSNNTSISKSAVAVPPFPSLTVYVIVGTFPT